MENQAKKQAEYQRKYEQNHVLKRDSFNLETEADLLELANSMDFSQWVKEQLREKLHK